MISSSQIASSSIFSYPQSFVTRQIGKRIPFNSFPEWTSLILCHFSDATAPLPLMSYFVLYIINTWARKNCRHFIIYLYFLFLASFDKTSTFLMAKKGLAKPDPLFKIHAAVVIDKKAKLFIRFSSILYKIFFQLINERFFIITNCYVKHFCTLL